MRYNTYYTTTTLGGYSDQKYDFTGKERDTETGLHYYGARYYDSDLGRWLQVDPQADEAPEYSPYNYCFNDPLNNIDPDGEFPWGVAAVGAIVGGASNAIIQATVNVINGQSIGDAVKNIKIEEVAMAAAAGAVGSFVGACASGLGKGTQIAINTVTDASLNAGSQYVLTGSVDVKQVVSSTVFSGVVNTTIAGSVTKMAKGTSTYKQLNQTVTRKQNIAKNYAGRAGRKIAKQNAAKQASKNAQNVVDKTQAGVNTTTSNVINKLSEKEEKK